MPVPVASEDPRSSKEIAMKLDRRGFVMALALSAPLAAQTTERGGLELEVRYPVGSVSFEIAYPAQQPYLGAVIVALQPQLTHYLVLLPPLLTDHVLVGFGVGDPLTGFQLAVPATALPGGLTLYAQGVVIDGAAILSSEVVPFVVNDTLVAGG
jgi:hypothetical protein